MNDINTCTFSGNLTRDAELKYTNSGTAICTFSMAVNEKWGDTDYASFFEFTIWGKYAEAMNNMLRKGLAIAVTAKAKQDRWEQDGVTRSKVKFTVEKIRMFSKDKQEEHSANDYQGSTAANAPIKPIPGTAVNPEQYALEQKQTYKEVNPIDGFESDIPF